MKAGLKRGVGPAGAAGAGGAAGAAGASGVASAAAIRLATSQGPLPEIPFDGTDLYDADGWHDPGGANPERLTVPAAANGKNATVTGAILTSGSGGAGSAIFILRRYTAGDVLMEEVTVSRKASSANGYDGASWGVDFANLATGEYFTLASEGNGSTVEGDDHFAGATRMGVRAYT